MRWNVPSVFYYHISHLTYVFYLIDIFTGDLLWMKCLRYSCHPHHLTPFFSKIKIPPDTKFCSQCQIWPQIVPTSGTINRKLILKTPRFAPFWAILAQLRTNMLSVRSVSSWRYNVPIKLCITSVYSSISLVNYWYFFPFFLIPRA